MRAPDKKMGRALGLKGETMKEYEFSYNNKLALCSSCPCAASVIAGDYKNVTPGHVRFFVLFLHKSATGLRTMTWWSLYYAQHVQTALF